MRPIIIRLICAVSVCVSASPAAAQPLPGAPSLRVAPYLSGLTQPVGLVAHPTDPRLQYVIEKPGRIRVVEAGVLRPEPFLDISGEVAASGEQGLLGLAFDPSYTSTRRFWINFTRAAGGATVIARFERRLDDPYRADETTRLDLRFDDQTGHRYIRQPDTNHNGGRILFGPDGLLYVAMGDGGGGNDPFRTAQDPTSLLGKMLRLDVHVPDVAAATLEQRTDAERGYRIPPDNPFVDGIPIAARGEIWAFGLRNPWRVSVDPAALGGTNALYIADVGQGAREEISYEPPATGGRNYGWPLREGTLVNPNAPLGVAAAFAPLVAPLHEYGRNTGVSITGGHVYRGGLLTSAMQGRYVFGDLTNKLFSLAVQVDAATGTATALDVRDHTQEVAPLGGSLVSIDADAHGELFLVMLSGTILRLTTTDDADGNGLPDAWEQGFGLVSLGPVDGGPFGDPDGDGLTNAEELRLGTHPRGGDAEGYFAEGATGFFATRISLLNDADTPRTASLRWRTADGRTQALAVPLGPRRVGVVDVAAVAGMASAEFETTLATDGGIVAAREMRWPAGASPYGSHSERAVASPALVWHFAEGATTLFDLFYLVQNTSASTDAQLRLDYRVQGVGTVARQYTVPAGRRLTIWVNQEAGLDGRELGATATSMNGVPLVVERAMYTRGVQAAFPAGHAAAGEPLLAPRWFFAEGATGPYFDTFLAVVNPHATTLRVHARVFLQDGSTLAAPRTFALDVPPGQRGTIWLDETVADDGSSLNDQGGVSVELVGDAPFVAERAMWWPGTAATWHEAHAAAGIADAPGPSWRVAGADLQFDAAGGRLTETYVLIANVGDSAEAATLQVYFSDREPLAVPLVIDPRSRLTIALADVVGAMLPATRTPLGVRIDAASPSARLYAEQAVYGTPPGGPVWARGSAHRASR